MQIYWQVVVFGLLFDYRLIIWADIQHFIDISVFCVGKNMGCQSP